MAMPVTAPKPFPHSRYKIESKSGPRHIIQISDRGEISFTDKSMLSDSPETDAADFGMLVAGERELPANGKGESIVVRDIGFEFPDGSVSTAMSLAGCVLAYRSAAPMKLLKNNQSDDRYRGIYGVTTVSVGIPKARYDQFMTKLKESYSNFIADTSEQVQGGYVWIDAGLGDKAFPESEAEYEDKYYTQVCISTSGSVVEALGPLRSVFFSIKKSLLAVVFGTLRLKATINDKTRGKHRRYRLGLTLDYAQVYDLSRVDGPGTRDKTEANTINKRFTASSEFMALINSTDPQDIMDNDEGKVIEDDVVTKEVDEE